MSETNPPEGPPNPPSNTPPGTPSNPPEDKPVVQTYQHTSVAARVPERVARGVYSTGQLVLDSPKEFVIDFMQGMTRPYQVVARVVVAPATMGELVDALRQNIDNYTRSFGAPPPLPVPLNPPRPTIQEIYENFKVPDEMMSGQYANGVMIGHSPAEFFLDFITGFYPNAAVSSRVFLPAPQAPRLLNTLRTALETWRGRMGGGGSPGAGGSGPTPPPGNLGGGPIMGGSGVA